MDSVLNSSDRLKTGVGTLHQHGGRTGRARERGEPARLPYGSGEVQAPLCVGQSPGWPRSPPGQSPSSPCSRSPRGLHTQSRVYLPRRRNQSCQNQAFWDAWRKTSSSEEDSTVQALET